MTDQQSRFDGLSADYDRFRPRYPTDLLQKIVEKLPATDNLYVIDAGAGTGIALEGLIPLLGPGCTYQAVDISTDMVAAGRSKLPQVEWRLEPVEPFLETAPDVDLITAAQSFQWMDRPGFLRAAATCLKPAGVLAVLQNNRSSTESPFLDAYETLLEEYSPGYTRDYRDFDYAAELTDAFAPSAGTVEVVRTTWSRIMTPSDFIGMARSSTQVQRAISTHGATFLDRLTALTRDAASDGTLTIPYRSELFLAQVAA
ncbi:hypothetical protein GCM10012275_23170 [Longimycelium tulufanense]|uniref:Methyltransferase type 12 domain-containing protein n=1 Tax=Longimycelium tulufanense TaxID=907463 RepID=A0A8J3CD85_9PSEU|nr:class I SAM-dependent methyltransferase [Longimycelium tulufanense]GGM51669.1 hypothetical protein GCM10012275_23170 [Longimycelium tulufanense]